MRQSNTGLGYVREKSLDPVREGVQTKKTFLNGHCPDRSDPPRGNGQRGPFFRPSKTTFKRVLRNQIPIENDRENDEYDDENGDNFDV